MEKIINVFVSSTYLDLKSEREAVAEAINLLVVPGIVFTSRGMENFFASNISPLEYAKEVIDQCDYYVLLIGARYGTIPEGSELSYTEQEYDYAMAKNIPVLAFIHNKPNRFPRRFVDENSKPLLDAFKTKILSNKKTLKYWDDKNKIATYVGSSLAYEISRNEPNLPQEEKDKGSESTLTSKPIETNQSTEIKIQDETGDNLSSTQKENSLPKSKSDFRKKKKPATREEILYSTAKLGLTEKIASIVIVVLIIILLLVWCIPPVTPPDVTPTVEPTRPVAETTVTGTLDWLQKVDTRNV